jgi:hypothetical protein
VFQLWIRFVIQIKIREEKKLRNLEELDVLAARLEAPLASSI